jgi:outer membrane protein OmpA-like peptidoglycan-associated protein
MEFIMKKNLIITVSIIAVALFSGCKTAPPNVSLAEAHNNYNSANLNPNVTDLAAVELKDARDTLNRADEASKKGEKTATVNQLAYLASQKVAIAEETAKRKSAEMDVTDAKTRRDQIRLDARTAEADAAKQQVVNVQATSDMQAAALVAADAKAKRDQTRFEAKTAEADAAKQQAANMQETAEMQAAALAAADAKSKHDKALIAQQEMQLKELNAIKTERGLVLTLGDVSFNTNKAKLKSGALHNVQKLSDFLKQYPQHNVLIEGYTDSTGSNELNQKLSERRADSVRNALTSMGISNNRISTHGYGENYPVAANDTAANRQLNRRVEVIISDENGKILPR